MWSRGFLASLVFHVVLTVAIVVGIPIDQPKPEQEKTVSVEIVPPPEKETEKEKEKAEEAAPKEAPAPPPPKSAEAEKPPQQAEQPPSPPPAQDAPEEASQQAEPPSAQYRPVFQFGEKDAGPEQSTQGTGATEEPGTENAASEEANQSDDGDALNDAGDQASPDAANQQADKASADEPPPSVAAEADKPAAPSPPAELTSPGSGAAPSAPNIDSAATPRNADETAKENANKSDNGSAASEKTGGGARPALKKARKLFSASANDDPMAAVALGIMSRSERGAVLCNSELGAQLANGSPQYAASRLPKPPLTSGNVIDTKTAFSTRSQWYDVTFRCEVDKDAMKVVSFAYDVGPAIPKSDWKKRRLPTPY